MAYSQRSSWFTLFADGILASFGRLIPFLLVVITAFALYQLVAAIYFASRQAWAFAGLYAVMAIAGGALARALWINRRKLSSRPRE